MDDIIIVYHCICVIFQFKTSVKLKRGCVEPLSRVIFGRKPLKIVINCHRNYFPSKGVQIFAGHIKPPKIVYFWRGPLKIEVIFGQLVWASKYC
jgi:hypothetical protein